MYWNKLVRTGVAAGAICLWLVGNGSAAQVDLPQAPDTEVKPRVNAETQVESEVEGRGNVNVGEQPDLRDRTPERSQSQNRGDAQNRGKAEFRGDTQDRGALPDASIEGDAESQTELGAEFDESGEGLTISSVQENSIAAQAGLRSGDQIVSIDGREFTSQARINAYLQQQDRRNVPMIFLRDGQRFQTTIVAGPQRRIARRVAPPRDRMAPHPGRFDQQAQGRFDHQGPPRPALGVTLAPGRQGVMVSAVYPDSPAHVAGLWPQDEIVCINGWAAGGVNQFMSTVAQLPIDRSVSVTAIRDGRLFSTTLNPIAADQAFAGEPIRSRDQLMARGEFGDAPIPPRDTYEGNQGTYQDQRDPQRLSARGEFQGQRRTALRPDFEGMSREQLQQELETLQRENESLRRQLNSTRSQQGDQQQPPRGAETQQDNEPSAPPPAPESSTTPEPPPNENRG